MSEHQSTCSSVCDKIANTPLSNTTCLTKETTDLSLTQNSEASEKQEGSILKDRVQLLLQVGEECQTPEELSRLVAQKAEIICYDGFEPSGRMHIAQGVFKAINVNRCVRAGCTFVFWVADWFALMNDKMGGELEKIKIVGEYFMEVWRASGMEMGGVRFDWASEEINKRPQEYWTRVLDIGRKTSLGRILKCCQIMGRKEGNLSAAQVLYPLMQCTDIFFLKADICQLGLDQRKVNMLAREYCDQIKRKLKPVVLSHHMIQGLQESRDESGTLQKMSKSNPDSAIFMEDSEAEVRRKVQQAYCPGKEKIEENPCLDYIRNIVFGRESVFLGYTNFKDLREAFAVEKISEEELKEGLAAALNRYVEPVRNHFATDQKAKRLLEKVSEYRKLSGSTANTTPREGPVAQGAQENREHLVAWLYPTLHLQLGDMLHLVHSLNEAVRSGKNVTLVSADWSSFSSNHIRAEEKDIKSVLEYNLKCLQSYGLNSEVRIVTQSRFALKDPNAYWIEVIQIGRACSVSELEKAWGSCFESAGQVLSALMTIADIRLLKATEILADLPGPPSNLLHLSFLKRCEGCQPLLEKRSELAFPSLADPGKRSDNLNGLFKTCDPTVALSGQALTNFYDTHFLCDDTETILRRKLKKTYGPPLVVENNPLIELTNSCFVWLGRSKENAVLEISRPDQHGGDKFFSSIEEVSESYRNGSLHPGDLKAALLDVFIRITAGFRRPETIENFGSVKDSFLMVKKRLSKAI